MKWPLLPVFICCIGCNDDFLNLTPIADQAVEDFYKTPEQLEQAAIAAYDILQQIYEPNNIDHFAEVRSDNTYNDNLSQNGGEFADFDNFNLASGNSVISSLWRNSYIGIQRCNIVLNRIGFSDLDDETKSRRAGEVLFIRSLLYFNIVRIWGDAPLVLEETTDPLHAFEHVRTPKEEIYTQIISDLRRAINFLPLIPEEAGRVSKGAGQTLLGKVYLTLKQYENCVRVLNEVVFSGQYRLLANFADIFSVSNENHAESIFEVQFKKNTNGEGDNSPDPSDGLINNRPSNDLMNLFRRNRDDRFEASVTYDRNGLPYSAKRSDVVGSDNTFGKNVIILRMADVLLMLAEALNEVSYQRDGNAFNYLNQVRLRGGAATYSGFQLQNRGAFREAIKTERRLELAFENHRWFDLVRTGDALKVMTEKNKGGTNNSASSALPFNITDDKLLYPLPLASGGSLIQNPGYN